MASIVTLAEFKDYLGDAPASDHDALLTQILFDVVALFESETGREVGAYRSAGTARTEVRDGTGTSEIYLDYSVSALTSVKLGYNSASPDETLTVADKAVINWSTNSRRLTRTDGGTFGKEGQSRFIEVVYNHAADVPDSARLAIKSVSATAYRRRGSEEVKSESVGSFYSYTLIDSLALEDPFWQAAVGANLRVSVA